MSDERPTVGVVVINWNQADLVRTAVASARASRGVRVVIVIVDNGSRPDSTEALRTHLGEVVVDLSSDRQKLADDTYLIRLGHNAGFTGANNAAFRFLFEEAGPGDVEYAFLLNSDASLEADALAALCRVAESEPNVGLLGSLILAAEDRSGRTISFGRSGLSRLGVPVSWDKGASRECLPPTGVVEGESVGGAAMLIPRDTYLRIGGQDDRFFFDVDDTEISLRSQREGLRNLLVLDSVAWHAMGTSVKGRTALSRYYNLRNLLLLRAIYRRGGGLFWGYFSLRVARDLAAAVRDRDLRRARAVGTAIAHHRQRRYGIGPAWLYTT